MKKQNKVKSKKAKSEQEITKKMSFAEIIEKEPESASVFMEKGMHCCGCPMAMQESLEQGALAHGLDADEIVKELNEKLKKKKKSK